MKKFSFILMTMLMAVTSTASYALNFTRDDADQTFRQRGPEGSELKNAEKAAQMFASLQTEAAGQGADVVAQAELLIESSKAYYYFAEHVTSNDEKKNGHDLGMQVADKAAKLLHVEGKPTEPKEADFSAPLANAFYWYSANMGKWGLANGILNSLKQWPDLRKRTEYILELGQADVESYGANRILAKAYFTLPFPLGDTSKSLELLEEANMQSLDDAGEISTHSTNVVYYADVLIAKGKKAEAKKILLKLIEKGASAATLKAYNEDRIPETKEDIAIAKKLLERT